MTNTPLANPLGEKCTICGALKSLGCIHLTRGQTGSGGEKLLEAVDMSLVNLLHKVLLKYQESRGKGVSYAYAQQLFAECDAAIIRAKCALKENPGRKIEPGPVTAGTSTVTCIPTAHGIGCYDC